MELYKLLLSLDSLRSNDGYSFSFSYIWLSIPNDDIEYVLVSWVWTTADNTGIRSPAFLPSARVNWDEGDSFVISSYFKAINSISE